MFVLTFSTIWSLGFFFVLTYLVFFFSLLVYLLPITLTNYSLKSASNRKSSFYIIGGLEACYTFLSPVFIIFIILLSWSSPHLSVWFGHITFSSFQVKFIFFISFIFYITFLILLSVTYMSSVEIYDFFITQFSFFYWVIVLFMTNTLFTLMFIIEVISTLIFLLVTTSVFSTTFFYRNINFDILNFFAGMGPLTFLRSIFYFFWVSLISSLNLFVFLIYMYKIVMTFDWFLIEHIFLYFTMVSTVKSIISLGLFWFFIIFSIFLKCGIAPLYLWKPTFFKGLSLTTLLFYISFFYFYLFLFLVLFLTTYMHVLFYYYTLVTLLFVTVGLLNMFIILFESFYIKTFFALSSILNSLLVLLSITAPHNMGTYFFI